MRDKLFKSTPHAITINRQNLIKYYDETQTQPNVIPFNMKEPAHNALVETCTNSMTNQLSQLQALDRKVFISFTIGFGAFLASWLLLPTITLALGALTYGCYHLAKRQQAYADYKLAFENLEACCVWSLGKVAKADKGTILQNSAISKMNKALGSVMNEKQLKDAIDDSIEDAAIIDGQNVAHETIHPAISPEDQKTLNYKLYGKDQGSFMNILQGVAYLIQTGFNVLTGSKVSVPDSLAMKPA